MRRFSGETKVGRVARQIGALFAPLLLCAGLARAQSWDTPVLPVPLNVGPALLLTDGTILVYGFGTGLWWELFPDDKGNYAKGIFVPVGAFPAGMNYDPNYFASAVLPDGRVIVEGGEYNQRMLDWTKKGAIYDPTTLVWTEVKPPTGWTQIGDAQSVVKDNGTLMLANINDDSFALLDASTLTWTTDPGAGKTDSVNDEEGWTLLPGGDIMTINAYVFETSSSLNDKDSEIFSPKADSWSSAGSTIVQLWDSRKDCGGTNNTNEVGPAVLLPDGRVWATGADTCPGAAGHTAFYNTKTKKWTKGPDFPGGNDMADAPAAVLPNGHVLVEANPGYGNTPVTFYEFDGKKFLTIPQPPGYSGNSEGGRMVLTPNGTVMLTHEDSTGVWFYHPASKTYKSSWQPVITKFPSCVTVGNTYTLKGKQFNGMTQGAYFGDDSQSATNYPLVRIKNNATGDIFFARTHDFSSGVATGSKIVSTKFDVPGSGIEIGPSTLEVIANGIPSKTKKISVESPCL